MPVLKCLLAVGTADLTLGLRPLGLSPGSQGSAAWVIEILCAFGNLRRAHLCGGCRKSGRKGSRRQVGFLMILYAVRIIASGAIIDGGTSHFLHGYN